MAPTSPASWVITSSATRLASRTVRVASSATVPWKRLGLGSAGGRRSWSGVEVPHRSYPSRRRPAGVPGRGSARSASICRRATSGLTRRPAKQPVAKVADPAWPRRDRARTLNGHGDGQETGGAPSVADVGGHGGPSDERRASLLRAAEPGPGGFRIRCVRRGVVRGFLRGQAGPSESASGSVFPDAVHRLFRGVCRRSGGLRGGWPIR